MEPISTYLYLRKRVEACRNRMLKNKKKKISTCIIDITSLSCLAKSMLTRFHFVTPCTED